MHCPFTMENPYQRLMHFKGCPYLRHFWIEQNMELFGPIRIFLGLEHVEASPWFCKPGHLSDRLDC